MSWARKNSFLFSPDLDRRWRRELVIRHLEVERRRPLPDARRGVVHRPVAWAEIAAVRAAVLALANAQRNAAEVGANTERDQPIRLAGLSPLSERLRVAQLAQLDRIGFGDLLGRQVA